MTEYSYFWNGIVRGDAEEAPYSSDEYAKVLHMLYGNVSGILDTGTTDFEVFAAAGMTVSVTAGYCVIKGTYFRLTPAETLTIAASHATLNRWDRIVIRINYTTKSVAPVVIQGGFAAVPSIPNPVQIEGSTWDMPIASVYVAAGSIATSDAYILDDREYVLTPYLLNNHSFKNFLRDCEFIGGVISSTWTGGSLTDPMSHMTRGWSRLLSASSTTYTTCPRAFVITRIVTLRGRVEVISGSGYVTLTPVQFAVGAGTAKTKNFPHPGVYEFTVRYLCNSVNFHGMRVTFGTNASSSMKIGQATLTEGPIAAPYGPKQDFIFALAYPYTYTNIGSGDVDITTLPVKDAKALLVRLGVNDSGSAGGSSASRVRAVNKTSIVLSERTGFLANDTYREQVGLIPIDPNTTSLIRLNNSATGANTLDVVLNIIGCVT